MWTGSVTGSHADNRHGVADQAHLARLALLRRSFRRCGAWRLLGAAGVAELGGMVTLRSL